jgi:hypothetical protein
MVVTAGAVKAAQRGGGGNLPWAPVKGGGGGGNLPWAPVKGGGGK